MQRRPAFTLIEFILVLAILSILLALLLPAVQKARAAAQRAQCSSNLHQIGLAVQAYNDSENALPPASVQHDGVDLFWAPYDDRPGTSPTLALPDYVPDGLIFPYLEHNPKIFNCPNGFSLTPGLTLNQPLQLSYAINGTTSGPAGLSLAKITTQGTSNVLLIWEHSAAPACSYAAGDVNIPWPFNQFDSIIHYPPRHNGSFNVLYCDGHVVGMQRGELEVPMFSAK